MTKKKEIGCIVGLLTLFVQVPLQFLLWYLLMNHVHATDLMWFLFWIEIPLAFAIKAISVAVEKLLDE